MEKGATSHGSDARIEKRQEVTFQDESRIRKNETGIVTVTVTEKIL